MRWWVLRILIHKEILRYYYNWGLLTMLASLLGLAILVMISARMNILPGQGDVAVYQCFVIHSNQPFARFLLSKTPPPGLQFQEIPVAGRQANSRRVLLPRTMAVEIIESKILSDGSASPQIVFWYLENSLTGSFAYRDWIAEQAQLFFKQKPLILFNSSTAQSDLDGTDRIPMVITALVVFALYLPAFNLFITSIGEEREKRSLQALLLTPATSTEYIVAKVLVHAVLCFSVAVPIVGLFRPVCLVDGRLWSALIAGTLGYLSLGTVIVSLVRKSATLNIASIVYLMVISIVTFLGSMLPLFNLFRFLLVEDHLFAQLYQVLSGQPIPPWGRAREAIMLFLSLFWFIVASTLFRKRGTGVDT